MKLQAKHIPDEWFLSIVQRVNRYRWGIWWADFHEMLMPEKVVLAKARALIRRGLLDGCTCGCRGDLEVTHKGREFLDHYVDSQESAAMSDDGGPKFEPTTSREASVALDVLHVLLQTLHARGEYHAPTWDLIEGTIAGLRVKRDAL